MDGAWVLTSDAMDYGEQDSIIGVFLTRAAGQLALTAYLQDALERHLSNHLLLHNDYTLTHWVETREVEVWTKRGADAWVRSNSNPQI